MKKILLIFLSFSLFSCETRDPDPLFFGGLLHVYGGQWNEAVQKTTEALDIDDSHLGSYLLRATAYLALQNYEACIQDCDRIIDISDTESVAYVIRADANFMLKKYPEALQDYEKAASLQSQSFWQMHILRQKASITLGTNKQAACEFWKNAFEQHGDYQSLSFISANCP